MNDLPPGALLDQNTLFICQGTARKQHAGLREHVGQEKARLLSSAMKDMHAVQLRGTLG